MVFRFKSKEDCKAEIRNKIHILSGKGIAVIQTFKFQDTVHLKKKTILLIQLHCPTNIIFA